MQTVSPFKMSVSQRTERSVLCVSQSKDIPVNHKETEVKSYSDENVAAEV